MSWPATCSGRCAPRSSRCPTTWPSTRPTVPGRSARHLRVRRGPRPSAASGPPTRCWGSTTRTGSSTTLLAGLGSFPQLLPTAPRDQPARSPPLPRRCPPSPGSTSTPSAATSPAAPCSSTPARSTTYAQAHPAGALSIEHRSVFASWLGWLVPLDQPVVFVLDDDTDRADLVRQCLTIGHDAILGELDGGIDAWAAAGLPVVVDPARRPGRDGRHGASTSASTPSGRPGTSPDAVHVELGALRDADAARRADHGHVRPRRAGHDRRQPPRGGRPPRRVGPRRRSRRLERRHRRRPRDRDDHDRAASDRPACGSACARTWRSSACSSASTRWSAG